MATLKEVIERSLALVEEEAVNKLSTLPSFQNTPQLKKLIGRVRDILRLFLIEGEGAEKIAREFLEVELPYPIAQKFLETLKVKILERIVIENGDAQRELPLLKERFKNLEREVAKVYLQRDVEEPPGHQKLKV